MELTREAHQVRLELIRVHGDSPDVKRLAEIAAQCWQRATEASARVDAEGLTVTTRKGGVFTHPAVTIERTSRLAYLSAVRAIKQGPKYPKVGRPAKTDAITRRFFPEHPKPHPKPGAAMKYLRPTS